MSFPELLADLAEHLAHLASDLREAATCTGVAPALQDQARQPPG